MHVAVSWVKRPSQYLLFSVLSSYVFSHDFQDWNNQYLYWYKQLLMCGISRLYLHISLGCIVLGIWPLSTFWVLDPNVSISLKTVTNWKNRLVSQICDLVGSFFEQIICHLNCDFGNFLKVACHITQLLKVRYEKGVLFYIRTEFQQVILDDLKVCSQVYFFPTVALALDSFLFISYLLS